MHSHVNGKRPAVQLLSVRYDASPRPEREKKKKTPQKKQRKVLSSRAFAKKDGVLNLCNPFVLLTHPPQLEQECLIHCGSVRSQISCIASADLFGVISWRLSNMWEALSNSEFQISTRGAKWGFREREGRRASECWHAYSSCLATRRLRNQTVITRTKGAL